MDVIGTSDEAYKKSAGKTFSDIIEDWGNKAMDELRESLDKKVTLTTSKALEQSIQAKPIAFDGKTLSVSIKGLKYADFLNEGVQGVGGEMKNGTRWTNKAPGSPFSFKKDKKPSVKHFTQWSYLASRSPFAVRETVFRSGIKANHFIDEVVNGGFRKEFAKALSEKMGRAIEADIKIDFNGK